MSIIRISVDNEISVHDFPEGSYREQNEILAKVIGKGCEMLEHVMPKRLYSELGGSKEISKVKGGCVSMLVDEEGYKHDSPVNVIGSYLYETDKHGYPILGNILIIGEVMGKDGIEFCGVSEEQFNLLYPQFNRLTEKARGMK